MRVNLLDRIGPFCITIEDGQLIYNEVRPQLESGEAVVLDFSGVDICASPFLNASVGQLCGTLKPDVLISYLRCAGLNEDRQVAVERVVQNALGEEIPSDTVRGILHALLAQ